MFNRFRSVFSITSNGILFHERLYVSGHLKECICHFRVSNRHLHQRKTSLYDLHVAHNGKIVNFGGFELPVQYGNHSISQSHVHTRNSCSIFDVSHMLQTEIRGKDRIEFLESLCPTDIQGLPDNGSALSVFLDDNTGGILDDFIVTKTSDEYLYVVSNASRRQHDSQLLKETQDVFRKKGKDVSVEFLEPETQSLIAVQGPKTAKILDPMTDIDLTKLFFMKSAKGTVCGIKNCRVTRCGYTGEDGVEISVNAKNAEQLVENLLKLDPEAVKLAGLGARDTLRLEAGLCLYGNDIDVTTTPVHAGLNFTISKRRREQKNFPAAPIILLELLCGPRQKRIGLKNLNIGPPARQGAKLFVNGENVGFVTSGCPSPNLGCNIAMGYVKKDFAIVGSLVKVEIRDKLHDMEICKLPFVSTKYYTKKK